MNTALRLTTALGDTARRLAWLQLLWLGHTLLGGVLFGIFPATAAVLSVLRRDRLEREGCDVGVRAPVRREFHAAWRSELVTANVLGWTLAVAWAVVIWDRRLLRAVEIAAAPALSVLLILATVVLAAVTALAPVLHAHFAESPLATLRRSLVLALARPHLGLAGAIVLAGTACLYYLLPGLAVVFGPTLAASALLPLLWRVLPAPATPTPTAAQPALIGA